MDEKQERRLRQRAVRWLQRGGHPTAIAKALQRSRQWLNKWWHRFLDPDGDGLKSQSRQPRHSTHGYPSCIRRQVVRARRILKRARVGLIGPAAVLEKLRSWRVHPLPSRATIGRILHAEGLTHAPSHQSPNHPYYPHPRPTAHYYLHAMDWTSHLLRGGKSVFAFNTIAYGSRDLCSRIYGDKSAETVCAYTLCVWHGFLGLPDGVQVDNDAAFSGGRRGPRVFSRFVRLCLYLGIEPIFIPFYEAERNELVEHVNGLWQQAFWQRRRFRSLPDVQRRNPEFAHWYRYAYRPPALQGQSPAQVARPRHIVHLTVAQIRSIPERLPITAGRVHFLREVDADGNIVILNETWRVGTRFVGKYVWAVIETAQQRLAVYYRRSERHSVRLVKSWRYVLREPVVPLRSEFRRRPRRRKVSTML